MNARKVAVKGVTLACEVQGAGVPMVFLHGFPFHHEMWRAQIEALAHEFWVIAPDFRGFGKSQITEDDVSAGVGMDQLAADVVAILDELGVTVPIVLVGFSMGGYAAFQLALRWPERLRGLILCDTRAAADADQARTGRLKMAEEALTKCDASPAEAMLPKLLAPITFEDRPDVADKVRSFIKSASPEAVAAAQRGMAKREDVRGRLSEIVCPALGVVGEADAISPPAEMREIVAALPHARIVEIAGAGHTAPLENPSAVTAAIADFARLL